MNKQKIRNRNVSEQEKKKTGIYFASHQWVPFAWSVQNKLIWDMPAPHYLGPPQRMRRKMHIMLRARVPYGRMRVRSIASDPCWEPAGETMFPSEIQFYELNGRRYVNVSRPIHHPINEIFRHILFLSFCFRRLFRLGTWSLGAIGARKDRERARRPTPTYSSCTRHTPKLTCKEWSRGRRFIFCSRCATRISRARAPHRQLMTLKRDKPVFMFTVQNFWPTFCRQAIKCFLLPQRKSFFSLLSCINISRSWLWSIDGSLFPLLDVTEWKCDVSAAFRGIIGFQLSSAMQRLPGTFYDSMGAIEIESEHKMWTTKY